MAITYDSFNDRLVLTDPGVDGTNVIKMRATVPSSGVQVDSNQFNVTFVAQAATLSAPDAINITDTTATLRVTTDKSSGTMFVICDLSSLPSPSPAQIQAGQNGSGATAKFHSNHVITQTGIDSFAASGLNPNLSYRSSFVHVVAGNNSNVSQFTFSTQPVIVGPTLTLNVATEVEPGTDSNFEWQTAFLLNDGRIASFGTGNHNQEMSNAMRIIDPVTSPGNVTNYNDFPWTQDISPPNYSTGINRYASHYDNHPSIYIPSENKSIWFDHGVFDHLPGIKSWTYGNRAPNTNGVGVFIDESAVPGMGGLYNAAVAWCSALDIGVFYGKDGGSVGVGTTSPLITVERKIGGPQAWKLVIKSMAGSMPNFYDQRNTAVCIGTDYYVHGGSANDGGDPDGGGLKFYKVDLITKTVTATLTPYPSNVGSFPQFVYDSDRNRIVVLGVFVYEYNPANDAAGWTNVTPANYPTLAQNQGLLYHVRGVYQPTLKAIYFNMSSAYGSPVNKMWHKLVFPQTGFTRWRAITTSTSASPFQGPPEAGFGGSKHAWLVQSPANRRIYNFGGDWGAGAGSFAGQVGMGSNFTTNEPSGAATYVRDSSLCNDMYSFDPFGTNPLSWRLEHTYLPRSQSGTREVRPARPDQASMVWDPVRSKFWCIYAVLRTEFLYLKGGVPDLWANGSMSLSPVYEPDGTYSWAPGPGGGSGTFTLETTNRLSYRLGSATSYNGGQLISGLGDERIGLFTYDAKNDVLACLSAAVGSTQAVFIFKPATKTYEYRTFSAPGYNRMDCSGSYCAIVDGWAHAVALATTSGGTRKSVMLRVNVTAALGIANQGTLTAGMIEVIDLPWSLSPGNVWESAGNAAAKWQEHCGVVATNRKIVLIKSYDGIVEDGTTKLTIWDPDARRFTAGETAPEALVANAWCALDTGEVLLMMNTSGVYSNMKAWAYRVGGPQGSVPVTPPPTAFQTSFLLTENPISESSKWLNGAVDGGLWHNVLTTGGRAVASVNADVGGNRFADDIAVLKTSYRTFNANQYAQAIVYKAAGYDPRAVGKHEVELLLRFSITNGNAHGYEVGWGTDGYLFVTRWNGPLGDPDGFTTIYDPGPGSIPIPNDGDVLRAEITGNIITVYRNGVVVPGFSAINVNIGGALWSTGQPGMGFWPVDGATAGNLGWKDYEAGDL